MINLLCDNKFNGCEALLHPVFGISCFVVVIITITFTWSFETREMKEPSSTKYKKKWIESSKEVTYEEIVSSKNLSQFLQLVDKQIVTSYGWNASRNVFNLNETKDVITKEYNISYELDKTQQEDVKCLSVDTKEMKIFESSVHRSIQKKYDTFLASLVI
jgi:LAS superfamily LD-carboxypeptidase LdcB